MTRSSKLKSASLLGLVLCAAGCFAEGEYVYSGPAGGVRVGVAPPPVRYEVPLGCGYGATFAPGHWDWNGARWHWRGGRCIRVRANHVYVRPYYSGGVYYRGGWSPQGRAVPPPAPAYPSRPAPSPGYVPPPPPAPIR